MFSGHHLMLKTPGSKVITWSWKQKLVGVSRTVGISWKIMKKIKTDKVSKIPKNNNFFTCLSLFRILVNLPNFEMPSHLNELDSCGLFLTAEWSKSRCHSVKKSPHKSNLLRCESISKLPGGKPMNVFTFGLWSSYQTWQLWNALTPQRVGLVRTFFNWRMVKVRVSFS